MFDKDPKIPVFTEGTDKMDREDMRQSLTMFYQEMGWDQNWVAQRVKP